MAQQAMQNDHHVRQRGGAHFAHTTALMRKKHIYSIILYWNRFGQFGIAEVDLGDWLPAHLGSASSGLAPERDRLRQAGLSVSVIRTIKAGRAGPPLGDVFGITRLV